MKSPADIEAIMRAGGSVIVPGDLLAPADLMRLAQVAAVTGVCRG